MAKNRPFAFNPSHIPITGTDQLGDLAIGIDQNDYSKFPGSVRWWGGPDEDLGYIITRPVPSLDQPNPVGVSAGVAFWRSKELTEYSFLTLCNKIRPRLGQVPFTSATEAKTWLNANGYWTSWGAPPFPAGGFLALEDGSLLLLEDGGRISLE